MVHKGVETLNAKMADGKVADKLHEYADKALAEAKKAYENPALREKAHKLLEEAKAKASDPAVQEKLKAAAKKLTELASSS
jgi:hypothetical protein